MNDEVDFLKFVDVLSKLTDVELILLKVHLLVEEMLTDVISIRAKNKKHILDARLSFYSKMKLARAYHDGDVSEWVWKSIELLNKSRNKLAHNLTADEVTKGMNEFICLVKSNQPHWPDNMFKFNHPDYFWASYVICLELKKLR
ncbi:MAG: hypothetical protein ACI9IA_000263 [Enterobacterales bacterium]